MALPETKKRCEVVDGVLRLAPSAIPDHQWITGEIFVRLWEFVMVNGLGIVLTAPSDLLIQRQPLRVRQPDIMFFNAERTGFLGRSHLKGLQIFEVPPDLVVEVLSPSNSRRDIQDKLEDYRQIGVLECWLVDPETDTVGVIKLTSEGIAPEAVYGAEDTLRSAVLEGLELPLRQIFG
jgi:Uma2 family endonuclease